MDSYGQVHDLQRKQEASLIEKSRKERAAKQREDEKKARVKESFDMAALAARMKTVESQAVPINPRYGRISHLTKNEGSR
mmetsp:Transcript_13105/g.41458  ORF Transcript_13105/g.41458 Transcript_13105/m.41458 type:complete len:80 (+) Transcript_13105:873-1112(+)